MANKLNLNTAEHIRVQITKQQEQDIVRMYQRIVRNIDQQAKKLPDTTSGVLRGMYLSKLKGQINEQLDAMQKELQGVISSNMTAVAEAVAEDNLRFLRQVNMPIQGAFSHVPKDVVESIITGQVYQGDWSLSKSIWQHTQKSQNDINRIIAEGVAQNKSAYDIAKDLEKYVNPNAKKEWDWSKVYPGTSKKVDYNAQRLARTMVSHAYQQSFVKTTQKNPFVTKYKWDSSNSGRVCELCASRDGQLYDKDDLPMDHPNGMCTYIAVMEDSMVDIADRIADWARGKPDPDLEEYAKSLYGSSWKPATEPKVEYRYHATKRSSILGITEQGLKPNRGHLGRGVYFADSAENALWWTAETSTGGTTLLRVSLDFLNSLGYEEYTADESGYGVAEGLIDSKVPFDKIQIKVGNEWWSLSDYAHQYSNSIYKRLSPSAQKRVDKQWKKETEERLKNRIQNN